MTLVKKKETEEKKTRKKVNDWWKFPINKKEIRDDTKEWQTILYVKPKIIDINANSKRWMVQYKVCKDRNTTEHKHSRVYIKIYKK